MRKSEEQSLESLFFNEASDRFQSLLEFFEEFKTSGDGKENILRILHTLKGSAGLVGFQEQARRIHQLEEHMSAVEPQNEEQIHDLERALLDLGSELQASHSTKQRKSKDAPYTAPYLLTQKLLASVSKCEALWEQWSVARERGESVRDSRVKAEMAFGSELHKLRKHSFRLAFGHPRDLFQGLEQLVGVVAGAEGKQVNLSCHSSASYLLREFIPELRATLVHLLSNSVVHGIESPQVRVDAGKDAVGAVDITLEAESDKLVLLICDDGAGVDMQALEARHRESKSQKSWSQLKDSEKLELLFEQGTTLRKDASVHAGRGVGLSAVKETAERLGGQVCFEPRDVGSCVRFTIPSPFFIANCLMVESGGNHLAVVASSIERVEELEQQELPSLSRCLRLPDRAGSPRVALWVDRQNRVGVSVDECFGLKETVVYPLSRLEGLPEPVVGLSDFGQGKQLAVDLARLTKSYEERLPGRPQEHRQENKPQVMVVDDSETTRSIMVDVLDRAGFCVVEATDGIEALELLETNRFDLVVSDLEMPNMNGLEFLENLRRESSPHGSLPFILFTSRDDSRSFQKAYLLGADRCVGKSSFLEADFLRMVEELI